MKIILVYKILLISHIYIGTGSVNKYKILLLVISLLLDMEVVFSLEFNNIEKFYTHFVFFILKPGGYRVEFSLDNEIWTMAMDFREPPKVF